MDENYISTDISKTTYTATDHTYSCTFTDSYIQVHAGVRWATDDPGIIVKFNTSFNVDDFEKMYVSGTIQKKLDAYLGGSATITIGIMVNDNVVASTTFNSLTVASFEDAEIDLSGIPEGSECSIFIKAHFQPTYNGTYDYGTNGLYNRVRVTNIRLE